MQDICTDIPRNQARIIEDNISKKITFMLSLFPMSNKNSPAPFISAPQAGGFYFTAVVVLTATAQNLTFNSSRLFHILSCFTSDTRT